MFKNIGMDRVTYGGSKSGYTFVAGKEVDKHEFVYESKGGEKYDLAVTIKKRTFNEVQVYTMDIRDYGVVKAEVVDAADELFKKCMTILKDRIRINESLGKEYAILAGISAAVFYEQVYSRCSNCKDSPMYSLLKKGTESKYQIALYQTNEAQEIKLSYF